MTREQKIRYILEAPAEEVFTFGKPSFQLPERARLFRTVICEQCGEGRRSTRSASRMGKRSAWIALKITAGAGKERKREKFSKTISLIAAVLLTLSGCGQTSAPATSSAVSAPRGEVATAGQQATRTVTDLMGRQVELPQEIDSVICTGSGALRLVCYAQGADLVTGVEDTDKKRQIAGRITMSIPLSFRTCPASARGAEEVIPPMRRRSSPFSRM